MKKELKIYIYKEIGVDDRFKIGQTKNSVEDRIRQQTLTAQSSAKCRYELVFEGVFQKEDGTYVTDGDIHKRLDAKGFVHPEGAGAEWRICSLDDILGVAYALQYNNPKFENRTLSFKLRPEQQAAINQTAEYFRSYNKESFKNETPKFLWNAKMRFGKCFTCYHLAKEMGWTKLLVLTYKPVVSDSWRNDLENHIDFSDWAFSMSEDSFRVNLKNDLKSVVFYSFQDLLGSGKKELKPQHKWILNEEWDCLILDEYHFGARGNLAKEFYETEFKNNDFKTEVADGVTQKLIKKHLLCLSGTPFKSIESGEFNDCQIFNWTYLDEQFAKESWNNESGPNPYSELPRMKLHLYAVPEWIQNFAQQLQTTSFDLNHFFSTDLTDDNQSVFKYKDYVERFLKILDSGPVQENSPLLNKITSHNLDTVNKKSFCLSTLRSNHMVWLFTNVASCYAMKNLLEECRYNYFSDFKIILMAGDAGGSGKAALSHLKQEMCDFSKTITLTCGKLMTGTTVSDWDTILLLTNLKAPETYFQSIFRVQSPFSEAFKDKKECHVVDFNPNRALIHLSNYFLQNFQNNKTSDSDLNINFSTFLPILMYDGFECKSINFSDLQEFFYSSVTDEVLVSGWKDVSLLNTGYLPVAQKNTSINETISKLPIFNSKPSSKRKDVSDTPGIQEGNNSQKHGSGEKNPLTILKEKDIIDKLKFLISRLYLFFYLYNEYIEEDNDSTLDLRELLYGETNIEPLLELFKQVTTLSVDEFKELSTSNLINIPQLDLCIQKINYKIIVNSRNRDVLFVKNNLTNHKRS